MKVAILLISAVLAGCNSLHAARDDRECQSYGLAAGTPEYANCRLQLKQIGAQRYSNAMSTYNTIRANRTKTCSSYWTGSNWMTNCY